MSPGPRVFLSYANEDRPIAAVLAQALESRGISVWWDQFLVPGTRWMDQIVEAIDESSSLLVLLTPTSVESSWVRHEWQSALLRSRLVIPVVAGGLDLGDIPMPLAELQGIRFDTEEAGDLDRLAEAIRQDWLRSKAPDASRLVSEIDVEDLVATVTREALARVEAELSTPPAAASELVFVIISFAPEMDPTVEAIQRAAETVGLHARRVKDEPGDYRITDKVLQMIQECRFVVADLTLERPNVYFELGYARGIGKTVVTLSRKGTDAHFDVQDWTYLEYSDSRPLERDLIKRFRYELGRG